jgi:hypothetical protein
LKYIIRRHQQVAAVIEASPAHTHPVKDEDMFQEGEVPDPVKAQARIPKALSQVPVGSGIIVGPVTFPLFKDRHLVTLFRKAQSGNTSTETGTYYNEVKKGFHNDITSRCL